MIMMMMYLFKISILKFKHYVKQLNPDKVKPKETSPKQNNKEKERQIELARKNKLDLIKTSMMENQDQYFRQLKKESVAVDLQLAARDVNKINEKILKAVQAGKINFLQNSLENPKNAQFEEPIISKQVRDVEKEKDKLRSKLKNIDLELNNLKNQKIDNPFSAYSQPTLKIQQYEENMLKQREAQEFVHKLNEDKKIKDELRKKQEELKKKDENDFKKKTEKDQDLVEKEKKHNEIKEHVKQIKQKHELRLKQMEEFEDKYFSHLNAKLSELKKQREHLKNKQYQDKSQLSINLSRLSLKSAQPRRKKQKKTRKIKSAKREKDLKKEIKNEAKDQKNNQTTKGKDGKVIPQTVKSHASKVNRSNSIDEAPLYVRIRLTQYLFIKIDRYEFNKKMEDQEKKRELKQKKKRDFEQQYNKINFEEHQQNYQEKLKILKKKFEDERKQQLQEVGIKNGSINQPFPVKFNSKLWILNEIDKQKQRQENVEKKIEEIREKKLKVLSYAEKVKNIEIKIDEQKKLQSQIEKDKLDNPQKYIQILKRKRPEQVKLTDEELFFQEPKQIDINPKDIGKIYLKQINENVQKIREEGFENNLKIYKAQSVKIKKKELPPVYTPKPDYLSEIRKKYNLEDKINEKNDWTKIAEEKDEKPLRLPKIRTSQKLQRTTEEINIDDLSEEEKIKLKRKQHNEKVEEIKKKNKQIIPDESKAVQKLTEVAQNLDLQAQRMEQVVKAQWETKPLKAVDQTEKVDQIYLESIRAKLKVLEMKTSKSEKDPLKQSFA